MSKAKKEINIEKEDFLVVDQQSGEVVNTFGAGDLIIHKEQSEYTRKYAVSFNKGESFVKLYDKTLSILRKKLTPTEFMLAISLAEYVSYKDCIFRNDGKILDMQDISKLLDIDYSSVRRLIPSLTKKGVIGVCKVGCIENPKLLTKAIICNPFIYSRGQDIDKTAIGLFENSGWREIIN